VHGCGHGHDEVRRRRGAEARQGLVKRWQWLVWVPVRCASDMGKWCAVLLAKSSKELATCMQVQVPRAMRHEGRSDRPQGNKSKAELWGSSAYRRAWHQASAWCSSGRDRVNVAAAVMVSRAMFSEAMGVVVR